MTKSELLSALEWFKPDAELFIAVPHPVLDSIMEIYPILECRYRLCMPGPRIEIVADSATSEAERAT